MTLPPTDPLQSLRDIHVPGSPPFWPLAPGWYVLMLGVLLIIFGSIVWYRYHTRRRRTVLNYLQQLQKKPVSSESIAALSILLRRAVLSAFPKKSVASLHGEAWLHFLNETGKTKQFTDSVGQLLLSSPYQSHAVSQAKELFLLIERWIKKNL